MISHKKYYICKSVIGNANFKQLKSLCLVEPYLERLRLYYFMKTQEWIEVNEKLPKIFKLVLVVLNNGDLRLVEPTLAFRIETRCGGWAWKFQGESRGKVVLWRPLPEMPKK